MLRQRTLGFAIAAGGDPRPRQLLGRHHPAERAQRPLRRAGPRARRRSAGPGRRSRGAGARGAGLRRLLRGRPGHARPSTSPTRAGGPRPSRRSRHGSASAAGRRPRCACCRPDSPGPTSSAGMRRPRPRRSRCRGAVFVDADEAGNRVHIGVEHAAAASRVRSVLARLGIPAAAADVEIVAPFRRVATLRGTVRPVVAGVQINFPGFLCSLGFNATRQGVAGFVTASHCTNTQGGVESTPYWQPLQTTKPVQIATETVDPAYKTTLAGCPSGRRCRRSDAAFAKYVNGTTNTLGEDRHGRAPRARAISRSRAAGRSRATPRRARSRSARP